MPFFVPIIIGGISLITGGYGVSKLKQGLDGIQEANRIIKELKDQHEEKFQELDLAGRRTAREFEVFGQRKLRIIAETFGQFESFVERLKKRVRRRAFEHPGDRFAGIDAEQLEEFKEQSLDAQQSLAGGFQALGTAAMAGEGAAALIGAFGVSSTGTAIGGLSGAAASNAMLAWLGGGSLAAGGGGMALGQIILGGIYVAPAALIGGLAVAKQGQAALTEAERFRARVRESLAKMEGQIAFLRRVRNRIEDFQCVLEKLDSRARALMESMVPEDLDVDSDSDMNRFACLCQIMSALWELVRFPLMTSDGDLNAAARAFLNEQERKAAA